MAESEGALHQAAKKLGKAGGKRGGPARAKVLGANRRSEIARLGGLAKKAKAKHGTTGAIGKKKG